MAFVYDHQPVPGCGLGKVAAPGERLRHGNIHHAAGLAPTPDLADLLLAQAEVLGQSIAPLVNQRLAVDDHQGRNPVMGDQGTGHDGLAGSRWSDEHPQLMRRQLLHCAALIRA